MSSGIIRFSDHSRRRDKLSTLPVGPRIERRSAKRYPIELPVRYTAFSLGVTVDSGQGNTIDMSSSGLRFAAERPLIQGLQIEIAIRWPFELPNGVALKLVVSGEIVRADDVEAAVRISRYESRTRTGR